MVWYQQKWPVIHLLCLMCANLRADIKALWYDIEIQHTNAWLVFAKSLHPPPPLPCLLFLPSLPFLPPLFHSFFNVWMEPGVLPLLDKCSTTEQHSRDIVFLF